MKRFWDNIQVAGVFLIIGIIAIAVGLSYINMTNVEPGEIVTIGRIVSVDENIFHADRLPTSKYIVYHPAIIEYKDNTGLLRELDTSVSSLGIRKIGSEVKVAYNETNPAEAHEVSIEGNIVAYVFIGFGVLLCGFVVFIQVEYWRKSQNPLIRHKLR